MSAFAGLVYAAALSMTSLAGVASTQTATREVKPHAVALRPAGALAEHVAHGCIRAPEPWDVGGALERHLGHVPPPLRMCAREPQAAAPRMEVAAPWLAPPRQGAAVAR